MTIGDNSKTAKVADVWSTYLNPLRYLDQPQIENMFSNARLGNDVRLQVCFQQVEQVSPLFQVCVKKRIAGAGSRQWAIQPLVDSEDSRRQAEAVQRIFEKADTRNDDGLTAAIRHLALAAFRGRSLVKPFVQDKELIFKPIQNWNALEHNGVFYWNPSSQPAYLNEGKMQGEGGSLVEIPKSEICYVLDDRPIDLPGIIVYLRELVGEEQWARFTEKTGIPQVLITVPEGTPDTSLEQWNWRAQAIYEGASGALPSGSEPHFCTEARAQDPFTSFLRHQEEMISMLALGGTLLTIAGSTGLGSDLARVQQEQYEMLVNSDCKAIQNALTDCAVKKVVNEILGEEEVLCRFTFIETDSTTPAEYLDLAAKAKAMGLSIDVGELKKLTKLTFISDQQKDVWQPQVVE